MKKGKYGEGATGGMTHDTGAELLVGIDVIAEVVGVVCTPATSCDGNKCKLLETSDNDGYSWQSGNNEQAWLENSSTRRRLMSTDENCCLETLYTASSTAVNDGVLPAKHWLLLVVRNLFRVSGVTSTADGDLRRFWDFLIKHFSEDDVESSVSVAIPAIVLWLLYRPRFVMLVVSSGDPTSAGGRNALLSSARPLLCLEVGTFHSSLTPDSFVAMTDEDNAGVLSLGIFHVSASFFCNITTTISKLQS